ncbi:hypothetical protein BT96DRAFT_1006603 [Gymnopus androsaceus JB14]|uniref:Uncharacterized protein n=1 Tax=Gymnopus androsaceus JB14 TaxID=1447944 RepID=A0A6A4GJQ2_9AGAR|nr:hypothetical protein BT96DRAFT_1006603 [Gymnopus androsaceus JB14]
MSGRCGGLKARNTTVSASSNPENVQLSRSVEIPPTAAKPGKAPKKASAVIADDPQLTANKPQPQRKRAPKKLKDNEIGPTPRSFASRTKALGQYLYHNETTLLTGNEPAHILQAEAEKSTRIQTRRSNKTVHPGTDLANPEEKRKTPPPKLSIKEEADHEAAKAQACLAELEGNLTRLETEKKTSVNCPGRATQPFVPPTLKPRQLPEIEVESQSSGSAYEEDEEDQLKSNEDEALKQADDGETDDSGEPPSKRKAKSQIGRHVTSLSIRVLSHLSSSARLQKKPSLKPLNYTSDGDYVSTGSFDPASEPATSEPSSRPSSRASMDFDDIEEDQEDNAAAVDLIGENNQGVLFGGFEPQDPIVQPAARNAPIQSAVSTPNALTKVKDNAPMISLQNPEPPVAKKKKSNKLNRNDLDPLIKKTFAKLFEPMLIHRIASLTPSWYPRGSPPNVWLVPTVSMLQTEYDAIVKQETNVAHAVRAGNSVFSCARTALYNYQGSLRVNSEKSILLFFLDSQLDNILDRAQCAQQAIKVSTDEKSGELDVDRGFLWGTFGLDETEKDGLFKNFCIMYTLGSYLKTANNNASIAQDMLTPDGRPKGALLMSIIACYRAFKYYKSGVFLVDSDDGRGNFSKGNWGLTTAMGAWVQEIYQEITDLDDGNWTSLLTLAITTYDSNYKCNPSQEQSARLVAASEAAAVQASLTPTPAPQAPAVRRSLKDKRTTSNQ